MKNTVLSFVVIAATVLGLNALVMADFTITDTFTRGPTTDLGTTMSPGIIYNWAETKSDVDQDAYLNGTQLQMMGYLSASANISDCNVDLFAKILKISVDVSVPATGEAIIEYCKSGTQAPFGATSEYFVGIHPSGVIYLKRNVSGNMVELSRVTGFDVDTLNRISITATMRADGVQHIITLNGTEVINVLDSSGDFLSSGGVALAFYGGWATNAIYDNLEITATTSEELIGPAASPNRVYFDGSFYNWENVWSGTASSAIVDGNTVFEFAGGDNAALRNMTRLPLVRGDGNNVRVIFELGIESREFDSTVTPCLYYFDNNWNLKGEVDFAEQRLPTSPGHFRLVGKTYLPPADATYASPVMKFYGNAVGVIMKSVTIEPAQAKPDYQPAGHRTPPVKYSIDSAQPDSDSAILSDAQITTLLSSKNKAVPQLVRHEDRIDLVIDGNSVPPVIHMGSFFGQPFVYFKQMYNAGSKITTVAVRLGPYGDAPGAPYNMWLGDGQYNFEPAREAIRYALARCPDAYVMLNLWVNVYNDWGVEHPNDVHADVNGLKGICLASRVSRYGGAAPSGGEYWAASNHSGQFAIDANNVLRAFGAWLESQPEGKVVIGAYLNGGADGQWFFANEPTFSEYNPGTLAAYKNFLRDKYGTDAALSAAWGESITFNTVVIPTAVSRFTSPDGRQFLTTNNQNCKLADFNAFLSISNTRRQIAFCKALKEGTSGRLLCGQYWPILPASYPLDHGDFYEMLNSPYVDFVSRGGMLGAWLHGKLAVHEFDLRNLKSGIETWIDYDDQFVAKSQGEFRRQVLAGFCRELAAGAGFHIWDMWGGWFWHPSTMDIVKEGLTISQHVTNPQPLGSNYVGVFVDEDAANHLISLGWYYNWPAVEKPFNVMIQGGATGWGRVGLPVKFFLMQDALEPNLVVPKVSIFLNPLTMTLAQADDIKSRFCSNGRVVVFMNIPGLAAPGDAYNPVDITGFSICVPAGWTELRGKPLVVLNSTDSLLAGIRPGTRLGNWPANSGMEWFDTSAVANADAIGTPLAKYYLTGQEWVGMLADRHSDYTMVWIGAPGALSPALIRNFAKEAGMTPILDNDNELIMGSGLLGVVGVGDGTQQVVHLPDNYEIESCISGHDYYVENGVLTFELGYGDLYGDVAIFEAGASDRAWSPSPATTATEVSYTHTLSWTAGSGANSHDIYFGTNQTNVRSANHASNEFKGNQTGTTYNPGMLSLNTTYYWRVDEVKTGGTIIGNVWSFTIAQVPSQASSPSPSNSATGVGIMPTLYWTAGSNTISHDMYFGDTLADVNNATHVSSQYKGNQGGITYAPGTLTNAKTYYWRIDEVGNGGTTKGVVWSFTTVIGKYIEKFQDIAIGTASVWTDVDLTIYGVGANQVVEIGIRNSSTSTARDAGVRTKGSSLARKIVLHAATTAGWDMTTMMVKTDANKKIQAYAASTSDVHFYLVGIWNSGDYTEKYQALTIGTTGAWVDSADLSTYGVGASQVVEVMASKKSTTAYIVGIRGNGSALDRKLTLHASTSSAADCLVMQAQADVSRKIEVWKGNTSVTFTLLGYWTIAPGTFTEKFVDVGKPTSNVTWYTRSLGGQSVPANAICEMLIANASTSNHNNVGVRKVGSSLSRLFDIHKSSASAARECGMVHVAVDGSSNIQQYLQNQGDTVNFYLLGYWN